MIWSLFSLDLVALFAVLLILTFVITFAFYSIIALLKKMKGGFNKILRNVVAGSSDTEFEKVSFTLNSNFLAETLQGHILAWLKRTKGKARNL